MGKITSKVYSLIEPRKLVFDEETLDPATLEENQVIAETQFSAISPGTEYAAYVGMPPLRPGKVYPRLMGYCNIARVIHSGSKDGDLKPGDLILTFNSHRTHFILSDSQFFIKVSPDNLQLAAPAYLYHLGYHALLTADTRTGHNIGIIGGGTLGYSAGIMSELAGANTFIFSGIPDLESKLHGFKGHVLTKHDDSLEELSGYTNNVGLDIVINTSNLWSDWLFALKLANRGATIVNLGFPGRGQNPPDFNPLDPQYVYTKQLNIKALNNLNESGLTYYEQRFNVKRNMEYILDLIKAGRIDSSKIITDKIGFRDLARQYDKYADRKEYMLSTLLQWID